MFARPSSVLHFRSIKVIRTFQRQYATNKPLAMATNDVSAAAAKAHDFLDFVNDSPTRTFHAFHDLIEDLLMLLQLTMLFILPSRGSPKQDSRRSRSATAGHLHLSLGGNTT